jgi:hypothetical protein
MKSKIFTQAEIEALEKRFEGKKDDPTGIYAGRVKPKLIEILEVWIPKKNKIKKTVGDFNKKC